MEYSRIQALALALGITALQDKDLEGYAPLSDGCSGRLSWLYALAGRTISCHRACVAHDFLYEWGGSGKDRRIADKLLRVCASRSGSFPAGCKGAARRVWRGIRAWAMYLGVRLFGGRSWGR